MENVESLLKKLDKLGGNASEILLQSMKKQTKYVQTEAKLLCPVDKGHLRNSITTEIQSSDGEVKGKVYTNVEYAPYVEFGTGKAGEETSSKDKYTEGISYKQDKWLVNIPDVGVRWTRGQPAQPFIYPALKNNKNRVLKNIIKDIKRALKKVAK